MSFDELLIQKNLRKLLLQLINFIPAQSLPSYSLSLNDRWTRNLDTGQPVDRQGTADTIISHDSLFKIVVIIV
jgi:hypothetical protein